MSDKDRTEICNIISQMLDNPDEYGIYQTSTAYTRLELYIESVRLEATALAMGWMSAEACTTLDRGSDPRLTNVPDMFSRALKELGIEK